MLFIIKEERQNYQNSSYKSFTTAEEAQAYVDTSNSEAANDTEYLLLNPQSMRAKGI